MPYPSLADKPGSGRNEEEATGMPLAQIERFFMNMRALIVLGGKS
jgi:hypothetical protein